ncbi:hypothetical protein BJ508DRAFT_329928 [Ascobolus immersus RN42]|uniref:F-box domain-containing protein n=1 Tax=Ascobolus immersus RN42 TaxID=1160509 RepID=A0A3N4HXE8_ASCIM|nr:hypothetical protein BJ508DRAFT_329928 [Ascobolus immersus RN42]
MSFFNEDSRDTMAKQLNNTSIPPILQLPNEILENIMIWLDDPHSYLATSSVNHRFRNCATNLPTRQEFAETWFATHCNDQPEHASNLIAYTVRYIHRHAGLKNPEDCLARLHPDAWPRWKVNDWRMWLPTMEQYDLHDDPILTHLQRKLGDRRFRWLQRVVERIIEGCKARTRLDRTEESEAPPSVVGSISEYVYGGVIFADEYVNALYNFNKKYSPVAKLDIEDVVFGNTLYKVYRELEEQERPAGIGPAPPPGEFDSCLHEYLHVMHAVRRKVLCTCGRI